MNLKERMDSFTAEVREELERLEEELRRIGRDRERLLEEARASDELIESTARRKEGHSEELRRIDGRIAELEARLAELRRERERVSEEVGRIEEQCYEAHRRRKSANDQARRLEHDREEKVREKQELQARVLRLRRRALAESLREAEARLGNELAGRQRQAGGRRELERLERERQEDPSVREWWVTLTEGEKILQTTEAKALVEAIRTQMEAARQKIEARFPGALSVRPGTGRSHETLEIPCARVRKESWIFLPVSSSTWEALKTESSSPIQEGALRLVWGLGKALGGVSGRFFRWNDWTVLATGEVEAEFLHGLEGEIPLPEHASLPFLLGRVPRDLEEALGHENP